MKIVALGDSITFGQFLPFGELAWPALIPAHDVVNAGRSSDTTRLMLERFPRDVQESGADMVLIQAGHNDCNRWESDRGLPRVSLEAYYANLREMVARARAFEIEPVLMTATPVDRPGRYQRDLANYNRALSDIARDECAEVIDLATVFAGQPGTVLPDGLHLSVAGHILYAAAVNGFLSARVRAAA